MPFKAFRTSSMYSGDCGAAEKPGIDAAGFYACVTGESHRDSGARFDKLVRRREYIVEH